VWRGVLLALVVASSTMPELSAAQIQGATRARLGVFGDAFSCTDARFVSYRRSTAEPEIVDQWYVASQLWADALVLNSDEDSRCYVDKGFVFLDRLWDYTNAGYFPRSNPVGTQVESKTRFGDDNSLGGLALLAAANATSDAASKQRYVHAATREADFLLQSGLWDTTFGGGFWWNTGRGDSPEGKPAQTNALAALFLASLYTATEDANYRDWALRTLLWLDTILFDPSKHLYRWSVAYRDIPARSGAVISDRLFNYDQGLAIQAQIAAYSLDGDANRLSRARDIGGAVRPVFWSDQLGGYNLEASVQQVFTSYSAWTSLGYLALYQLDADPAWLDLARENADALLSRSPDGALPMRIYACRDRSARGCESGQATAVDGTTDTAAQAWVQHLMTMLDVASQN
jgi:uncharacterized protein YyaL (SSP411 family)